MLTCIKYFLSSFIRATVSSFIGKTLILNICIIIYVDGIRDITGMLHRRDSCDSKKNKTIQGWLKSIKVNSARIRQESFVKNI